LSGERTWEKSASAQLWQYINPKLFSWTDVAHHKILILFKGQFKLRKNNPALELFGNSRWFKQF